jgi:uncharacterized membrane protein YeaQ/YmgE (transglycosylase-associated protein family)
MAMSRAPDLRPYTRGARHAVLASLHRAGGGGCRRGACARGRAGVTNSEGGSMGIMGIVWTIIVGLIVGALARWFYPGPVPMSWWLTALIGIGGSIVGGFISSLIWKSPDGKFHPAGWIMSILGAMILLWAFVRFAQ